MADNNLKEVPVYLFTGFIDSGKTTFIQSTLEDPSFNEGERTLLILCEEGEVVYDSSKFAAHNVKTVIIEDEEDLTQEKLNDFQNLTKCEKVVVEYNGMWLLDTLYGALPENWTVYQEMTFFDTTNIMQFNNNMRNIVVDKMKSTETIVFKNYNEDDDKMPLHKLVRTINRRCNIVYETKDGKAFVDDIEDELPYDMNKDIVEIEDKDYAIWYADMNDNEPNYYGKVLRFKGRVLLGGGLQDDEFAIGRHIMTCCVQDIQFGGLVAKWNGAKLLEHGSWIIMTAEVVQEYNAMYQAIGPVFHVKDVKKCDPLPADEEVATFY